MPLCVANGLGINNSPDWVGAVPEITFFTLCVGIGLEMGVSVVGATLLALVIGAG